MSPLRCRHALALAVVLLTIAPAPSSAATNPLACDSVWPPTGGGSDSTVPALINEGNALFANGDYRNAAIRFLRASETDGDVVAAHNLGAALEKLGQTRLGEQLCAAALLGAFKRPPRAPIPEDQLAVIRTGLDSGQWPQTPTPATTAPPTQPPTVAPTTPSPTTPAPTRKPTSRPSRPPSTQSPPQPSTAPPSATPAATSRPRPTPIATLLPTEPPPTPAASPAPSPPARQTPMIPLTTAAIDTGAGVFVGFLIGAAFGVQALRRREARRRAQAQRIKLKVDAKEK